MNRHALYHPAVLLLPLLLSGTVSAADLLFPMEPYRAMAQPWLDSASGQELLPRPFQVRKAADFQRHYLAPWDPAFVAGRLTPRVLGLEATVLANLQGDIAAGTGLGPNLQPYPPSWLSRIRNQLPPERNTGLPFQAANRAVVTENTLVRLLPTMDLYMHHPDLPGQGYPFDQLQNSVLWAGAPVYLLEETRDRAWCKVLAADCAGWIRAPALARAGAGFVRRWRRAVLRHGLVAAIATDTPVLDGAGRFHGHAFVGSVFPGRGGRGPRLAILSPGRRAGTHQAFCQPAFLAEGAGVPSPGRTRRAMPPCCSGPCLGAPTAGATPGSTTTARPS